MKSMNDLKTSNPEMVTISRTEYEEKNARLAFQDERISHLKSQIELLSFLFNEADMFSAAEKEEPEVTNVAGHKRHIFEQIYWC